jgi:hypothetical protein
MAHGRLPQPPSPQVPVLTGMPVSGMAYLDRPTEAGYFIFPDLSVRHEGKYRLSFNLYEETKEGKDADAEPSKESKPKILTGPGTPDSSFDWRLEVKSAMFTVFSAKKFPGLAESTVLSRTVAEQGCRVRIRRDVRMRRRDGKSTGDFEDAEDDYARSGRATEQSHDQFRERSQSGSPASGERAPYDDPQRRFGEYQPQQYQHYTPPVASHAPPPPGGHLGFMDRPSAGSQYAVPPPQFAQPQPPPAPQSYQPAPNTYHPPGPPGPPQYRAAQPPAHHSSYSYDRQFPQSAYPTNPPREQHEHFEEFRRASAPYQSSASAGSQYPPVDSNYRAPYHAYGPRPQSPAPATLPPLKMPSSIEPKYESLASPSGPLSSVNRIAPPLHSPSYERAPERSGSYSHHPTAPLPALSEVARKGKRSFDAVFSSSASTQPLYNGMRPSSSHHNQGLLDDDDDQMAMEAMKMSYRRADGTSLSRELPTLE